MIHALHGNAGMPDDLSQILRSLEFPYHAWHLWRFLDEHPEAHSLYGFADAFQASVERRGDSPRILFGYSLGARLALHALTRFPDKWDAAILISAHPGLPSEQERADRLIQDQTWAVRFLRDPWQQVMQAWNAQPVLAGETVPPYDQLLVETWRREVALAFDPWSLGRQDDLRPLLPAVQTPVLWLTGCRDEKFTALAATACGLLPKGQHVKIKDAGHRVHLDQPAAVVHAVSEFLKAVLTQP